MHQDRLNTTMSQHKLIKLGLTNQGFNQLGETYNCNMIILPDNNALNYHHHYQHHYYSVKICYKHQPRYYFYNNKLNALSEER